MAFSFEKFISDMMGNTDNTKKTNKKNAKTRIVKKKDDGGKAKLRASQAKDNAKRMKDSKGQGRSTKAGELISLTRVRTGAKSSKLRLTDQGGDVYKSKDNLKDRKMALAAAKKKTALDVIKKDTNIKSDKAPTKKVIVTKEQLKKSGLSLRDYMNFLKSQKTGRTITRDSRFDKKKKAKGVNT
tara:strand:- start:143 stop:694 length:552 start_codon:yes stop_codon:yes gene_type:complete